MVLPTHDDRPPPVTTIPEVGWSLTVLSMIATLRELFEPVLEAAQPTTTMPSSPFSFTTLLENVAVTLLLDPAMLPPPIRMPSVTLLLKVLESSKAVTVLPPGSPGVFVFPSTCMPLTFSSSVLFVTVALTVFQGLFHR